MSVTELSDSAQNYLKALWSLGEWSDDPVTTTALAQKVGVRQSTTSDAIRKLSDEGLVAHTPYGSIALTPQGRIYALAMVRRHRLIETFLVEVLRYTWDQVHNEAETLEHAVSDFMVDRIAEHLDHPDRDPHGDPIPAADGTIDHPTAIPLTQVGTGSRVRVERISDSNPDLLQFLAEHGIHVGSYFSTETGAPFSDSIVIHLEGGNGAGVTLGRTASDAMWVSPCSAA
ncbi:metal-dependent transcriptional regulator [Brevibacterium aurantiacum]|uniref:Manganese transport regulator n=2 Tax=Actinomycetes TaxID=1760 RepID=A0A2A3Z0J0_BREAU|nr:metal-dependent transcriptional regulator [Brevibacterium aurantiacum]PCC45003.1 transcriptional regulator [Brevibacterium aurantiacum]SMY01765.1 iron (metal) dependent repressor, DtxR family [Brevibacterium aurantiacum]